MLKAVAFDIDGTLYPQWQINLMSAPLYLRYYRLVNAYWRVRRAIRRGNVDPGEAGLHRYQTDMMAENQGWDPEETYRRVEELIYGKWHSFFPKVKLFPGLLDVLGELKERGFKLGVLSDFPVRPKLGDLGVDGWWDVAFCSEDYQLLKPRPEVFLQMAAQLGFEPDEILYIGNHYKYDILGGHRAGLRTAHLNPFPHRGSPAEFRFCGYGQFMKKFDQLQRRLSLCATQQ